MPSSEPIVRQTEILAMAFDRAAQYLWHIGRDGGSEATYVGANRPGKPHWLARAGEALTSNRLISQGVGIEWLTDSQRRAVREEFLRSLSNEAANGDPGAARI